MFTVDSSVIRKVAVIGNYEPRQCGIATFTTDVCESIAREFPQVDAFSIAMNDVEEGYRYPARVRFEIPEKDLSAYRRAAEFLNFNNVDVVNVQHEFGIFGGRGGNYLLTLLRELRAPVVTTLHTILKEPTDAQREVMTELIRLSDRLVIMSEKAREFLHASYDVSPAKVDLVPHGIPNVPFVDSHFFKEPFGLEGKNVILTFGLLSPDKGIENVIQALPEVLARHPDTVYLVVGATHPKIREQHGEAYRQGLRNLAERLGVADQVLFHNRFVSLPELTEFLGAADIYITPYLKREQITSGTLAYAVGSGKAVVSTPYYYAEELLADGRGILVPPRDPKAIAREINGLLDHDDRRNAMRRKAAAYGRDMVWPAVARTYMECFQRAREDFAKRRDSVPSFRGWSRRGEELPEINLTHIKAMTDDTGLFQHATLTMPNRHEGYCVDDNARALLLMAYLEEAGYGDNREVKPLYATYLSFVHHAFNGSAGHFRNFMSYDRRWLEDRGSEDSHGRCLWALGAVAGRSQNPVRQTLAAQLFNLALPAALDFQNLRGWAFALIGIGEYLRAYLGDLRAQGIREQLADRILAQYWLNSSDDWPWYEDMVTYCNGRIPQALLTAGHAMGRQDMVDAALRSLEWLMAIQTSEDGHFSPIGCKGFYRKGEPIPKWDQQPVEAHTSVSACLEAFRVTRDPKWLAHARRAFHWYLGQNEVQMMVYDPRSGGCRDGLLVDRLNENQGAESSLSFLLALLEMRLAETARLTSFDERVRDDASHAEHAAKHAHDGHARVRDAVPTA